MKTLLAEIEKLQSKIAELGEVYTLTVYLSYPTYGITSSGEEMIGEGGSELTFHYRNEDDAKEAKKTADDFEYTTSAELSKTKNSKAYPSFKEDTFLSILRKTVDPRIKQTHSLYRRDYRRRYSNQTVTLTKKELKKLDQDLDQAFKKHGFGVQINVMNLGNLRAHAKSLVLNGMDVGDAMKEAIAKFRH